MFIWAQASRTACGDLVMSEPISRFASRYASRRAHGGLLEQFRGREDVLLVPFPHPAEGAVGALARVVDELHGTRNSVPQPDVAPPNSSVTPCLAKSCLTQSHAETTSTTGVEKSFCGKDAAVHSHRVFGCLVLSSATSAVVFGNSSNTRRLSRRAKTVVSATTAHRTATYLAMVSVFPRRVSEGRCASMAPSLNAFRRFDASSSKSFGIVKMAAQRPFRRRARGCARETSDGRIASVDESERNGGWAAARREEDQLRRQRRIRSSRTPTVTTGAAGGNNDIRQSGEKAQSRYFPSDEEGCAGRAPERSRRRTDAERLGSRGCPRVPCRARASAPAPRRGAPSSPSEETHGRMTWKYPKAIHLR